MPGRFWCVQHYFGQLSAECIDAEDTGYLISQLVPKYAGGTKLTAESGFTGSHGEGIYHPPGEPACAGEVSSPVTLLAQALRLEAPDVQEHQTLPHSRLVYVVSETKTEPTLFLQNPRSRF
nr:hypothetical protein [Escherichia coli]